MDAVDVASLETDGDATIRRHSTHIRPYNEGERATIRACVADALAAPDAHHRTPSLLAAERVVSNAHCEAIEAFLRDHDAPIDLIGWHGQTVAHAPERGLTMQLGDADALSARLGLPVVADFRLADVAAGGQGAPLVPAYHRALVRQAALPEPVLVINLGGVANVTFIDGEVLIAFDTGPASAMIDDAMAEVGKPYDDGGAMAASGSVDRTALAALLAHPYLEAPPPKSLDRDAFDAAPVAGLALADRVATLTRFSAEAITRGVERLPRRPATVLVAGGGTHNGTLMRAIGDALNCQPRTVDALGLSADFMEAEAFAYLAVRSVRGLPLTFPGTTGVASPLCGGRLVGPGEKVTQIVRRSGGSA